MTSALAPQCRDLLTAYQTVRSTTDALCAPLSSEDQCIQSMPDVSPTKWHRAHVTWFFETFLLAPHLAGYRPFHPAFAYLFNSYYEAVGLRHPRPERGNLSRPSCAEVAEYRAHVDQAMAVLLAGPLDDAVVQLVALGLHHEQQHQELLLMDIKHVLSTNHALWPAYHDPPPADIGPAGSRPSPGRWIDVDGGEVWLGCDADKAGADVDGAAGAGGAFESFVFDNEGPRHRSILAPYRLADRLVTCGQWLEFMADGGYDTPTLWLSDGWYTRQDQGWRAPAYWDLHPDDGPQVFTLHGRRPVDPDEPVCHVSFYEADAFARWAGARLPIEGEWEHVAAGQPPVGNLGHTGRYHPTPPNAPGAAPAPNDPGWYQLFGDVWEWTASPYTPYPGFRPAPGAVGEYNGKFMVNQFVLRGGACVTPPGHIRATYRNFFHPHTRWHFSGVRLARDAP
ncbi:ergothioneine biosynthesis protein EgtB [Candidatus Poriferisocius sp.]|uniref:ergothioneine biosynthesis protein EgtB n=1 Tax=Candidatus Poriferisocius sp. TaxID=3101276 RepID=UPI003B5AC8DF